MDSYGNNLLTVHSHGILSVYTKPPNQAVPAEHQAKANESAYHARKRDSTEILLKNFRSLVAQSIPTKNEYLFLYKHSDQTFQVPDGTGVLTVTSPPFLDIIKYGQDNRLRYQFMLQCDCEDHRECE